MFYVWRESLSEILAGCQPGDREVQTAATQIPFSSECMQSCSVQCTQKKKAFHFLHEQEGSQKAVP